MQIFFLIVIYYLGVFWPEKDKDYVFNNEALLGSK